MDHVRVLEAGLSARTSSAVPSTPDEFLIESVAQGDRLAMQILYSRHHVKVYRFLLRFVGNEAMAEDLVTEVFFDAWRQANRFEGRSRVSTWLMAIARFKALSALRARSYEQLDDEDAIAIEEDADNPEVSLQRKQTAGMVRQCLTELAPMHREIIDLVYYHGKSVQEVSEIVCIPVGTVKTRMFAARKQLAIKLAAAGHVQ